MMIRMGWTNRYFHHVEREKILLQKFRNSKPHIPISTWLVLGILNGMCHFEWDSLILMRMLEESDAGSPSATIEVLFSFLLGPTIGRL